MEGSLKIILYTYSVFHDFLPEFVLHVHWISVDNCETGCSGFEHSVLGGSQTLLVSL